MPPKAAPRRAPARSRQPTESGTNPPPPTADNSSQQNASESRAGTPASAMPTGTPGPSAGPSSRPGGVQRLQSLKKRPTPSGSIARPAGAPKPLPLKGEPPPKPTLKYQPRAVGRRSKEEREAMEKLEAERHRERLAEAAQKQRGRGRGRGGSTQPRGRGGGGMFRGRGGPAGGRGRGGGRFSSSRSATRSIIDRGSRGVEQDGDRSSDESDSGIRVSIDQINIESDSDFDDEEYFKGKAPVKNMPRKREKGLRPIRVERLEHEERVVSVNMESSSKKSAELRDQTKHTEDDDDALFVQDDDTSATVKEEEKPRVKPEPTDDDETMMDAIPDANDDSMITDEGLPENNVRVRTRVDTQKQEQEEQGPGPADPRSLLGTKEDIEEFDRHARDLATVKELLAVEPKEPTQGEPPATATTEEKAADAENATAEEDPNKDKLSGQLFLLQFPPMTPNLVAPDEGPEDTTTATGDPQTGSDNNTTAQHPTAKREENGGEGGEVTEQNQPPPPPPPPPQVVTATDWHLQAGRVGKLNVHASGRVTLDWGGIDFELDRAMAVEFLQEALIVSGEEPDEKEPGYEEDEKRVWAMGQLSGKFTVTPNWERIL